MGENGGVMNEREEHIYLAGFFDGEGCISVFKQGDKLVVAAVVGGTHEDSILRFQRAFGGHIVHTKPNIRLNYKAQYQWRVQGSRALAAISAMAPFLVVKKPQAEVALRWPSAERTRNAIGTFDPQPELRAERQALRDTLRQMNKRGIAA